MAKGTDFELELSKTLEEFAGEKQEEIAKAVGQAAKQAKRDIVANSPTASGTYRKGWTVRTKKSKHEISAIIYNKDAPGLTHLLEKSHVIKNQFGTYGRSRPQEHIGPAAEKATAYLLELLRD